jgi:hypothetical protein
MSASGDEFVNVPEVYYLLEEHNVDIHSLQLVDEG